MTEKNKKLKSGLILGWIFFIALFIGRAIGIILTHDDVRTFGEFFNRLGIWDSFYIIVFVILISGSMKAFKRQEEKSSVD